MSEQTSEQKPIWFIKDEAIHDANQDEFAHLDLAREMKTKIVSLEAPLTISLESQHGTGKSVIGELLRSQFKNDGAYEFVRIEAWRHSGESRRKAFLYDVLEELKTVPFRTDAAVRSLQELQNKLYQSASEQHAVLSFHGLRATWNAIRAEARKPAVRRVAIAMSITAVVLILGLVLTANTPLKAIFQGLLIAFPGFFSMAGVVYFGTMLSKMADKLIEPSKITFTTAPPSSSEQFEQVFRDTLRVVAAKDDKTQQGKTLIILVDELDRLPAGEIIEAINVVRTFRDVKPCVVIVALDTAVVVRALQQTPKESAGLIRNDAEAEEFLNKFFKFRQHVPPLAPRDMLEFAEALVQRGRLTAGIGGLGLTDREAVLEGLIHPGVTTPRHVIRLLNEFNGDLSLAQRREGSLGDTTGGMLGRGAVTNNLPFLAIATVIREDFSEFYADLAQNLELINVIERGMGGKFNDADAQSIDELFPGYREVCAKYFAETTTPQTDIDWSQPCPAYRDLILHLQGARRFRAVVVAPFIFFREDIAARALGSGEIAQGMSAEFWNNAVSVLRGRFERANADNDSAFNRAAATVALHCMSDGRGSQRLNALLAVCSLFELFDGSRLRDLSDAVSRTADETRDVIQSVGAELSADDFLSVLAAHPDGFHQRACISRLIVEVDSLAKLLEPEEVDDAALTRAMSIFFAAIEYPSLFTNEQRSHISQLADHVSAKATEEDIQSLVDAVARAELDPYVRQDYLSPVAWKNITGAFASIKGLSSKSANAFKDALVSIEEHATNSWARDYISIAINLQRATMWSLRDLGFEILERKISNLQLEEAKAALKAVTESATRGGMPKRDDAGAIYLRVASWIEALCAKEWDGELLHSEELENLLDEHCAMYSALDNEVLRKANRKILEAVAPKSEIHYTKTSDALIGCVNKYLPEPRATEALQTLLAVPSETAEDKFKSLFASISAPLRSLQEGEEQRFAADSLSLAFAENTDKTVQAAALAQAEQLLPLISVAYVPSQLGYVSQVLARAVSLFSAALQQTYVNNLDAVMVQSNIPTQLTFVLNQLASLEDGSMTTGTIASISAHIINSWGKLNTVEAKDTAVELLDRWQPVLSGDIRDAHIRNMVDFAPESPQQAWKGEKPYWPQMGDDQRLSTVTALWGTAAQEDLLADGTLTGTDIGIEPVVQLLASSALTSQLQDVPALNRLVSALTSRQSEADRDAVADGLFENLAGQSEPLNTLPLFQVGCNLQSNAQKSGTEVLIPALNGDERQRELALQLLPSYLRVPADDSVRDALRPALFSVLIRSREDRLHKIIGLLESQNWLNDSDAEAALKQVYEGIKKDRSRAAKEDRHLVQEAIKKINLPIS